MTQPSPSESPQEQAAPAAGPPPDGADEWDTFTKGLGLLVHAAARVEYILHGLTANITDKDRAYGEKWASKFVTDHIGACESKLKGSESPIPSPARDDLLADLTACRKALERRNLFIHCLWQFDEEETGLWVGIKANREKDQQGHLQVEWATSEDLRQLITELQRLNERLIAWDIEYFGEAGVPEQGQPERVSVKRISGRRP